MAKMVKKAQEGTELRKGQYKRIGRISEKNPERAQRVADRMNTRASRIERGKEIANPPVMIQNPIKEYQFDREYMKLKKSKDDSKMKMGGSLKKPAADQKGLKKLPTPVRNKMGFKKNGGAMSKKK
jgi:protein subunit release factor B